MESALLDVLIQNGGLGLFAAYLIWQASRSQAQISEMTAVISGQAEQFGKQLEKIRDENQGKVTTLRDRYDQVISGLQERDATQRESLSKEIALLTKQVSTLSADVDSLGVSVRAMEAQVAELKMREIARGA